MILVDCPFGEASRFSRVYVAVFGGPILRYPMILQASTNDSLV